MRFYFRFMKRPALKIVMPFYNTGRDYTYVAKDHAEDFQKTPIRSKLQNNWTLQLLF